MSSGQGYASDATSLGEVVAKYEEAGYTAQMAARDGGMVVCFACRAESAAPGLPLDALCRIEGASDPADMLAVMALRCPQCGARGTLVVNYGPDAPLADADVLRALEGVTVPTMPKEGTDG